jgi:hypothetical protein
MNAKRMIYLVSTPVVVVGIYAWLIRNALLDASQMIKKRWTER